MSGGSFSQAMRRMFSIDYRSLALFRIALALLILFDLGIRSQALVAHYTDIGVLSREAFVQYYGSLSWWSLHLLSGSSWFQIALFCISAIFAIFLLVGWRTRITMIVSWLLLISLQTRNPLVLQGGDIFFRMLAFWAMFLPLGARWSIDALHRQHNALHRQHTNQEKMINKSVFSFGSAGLLLQVAFVYIFTVLLKSGREWFPDGSAVYFALSVDQFATHIGKWLLMQESWLMWITYGVYFFEFFGAFLLFVPVWSGHIRTLFAFAFVILQLGMGLSLRLGPFPWISSAAMIVFLPAWFWDKFFLGKKINNFINKFGKIIYRKSSVRKIKYRSYQNKDKFKKTKIRKSFYTLINIIAVFFIIYIFLWNVQTLGYDGVPDNFEWVAFVTRTDQMWNMFSPYPLKDDGWYVIPATLVNGSLIDLAREGLPLNWEKPLHVAALYPHERWRKYQMNLWQRDYAHFRSYYLEYLCHIWNSEHEREYSVKDAALFYMLERTLPDYQYSRPEQVLLHEIKC